MEKELLNSDKELLLKDLCGRLPYEVKVQYKDKIYYIDSISSMYEEVHLDIVDNYTVGISEIKPYLFPLSSMTGRLKAELFNLRIDIEEPFQDSLCEIDFYHKKHFDYRGLIEKGLAIDATGLNIY